MSLTVAEAKVSTFFLTVVSAALLSGALCRWVSHGRMEPGVILAFVVGVIVLIFDIVHVGLD